MVSAYYDYPSEQAGHLSLQSTMYEVVLLGFDCSLLFLHLLLFGEMQDDARGPSARPRLRTAPLCAPCTPAGRNGWTTIPAPGGEPGPADPSRQLGPRRPRGRNRMLRRPRSLRLRTANSCEVSVGYCDGFKKFKRVGSRMFDDTQLPEHRYLLRTYGLDNVSNSLMVATRHA